MPTYQTGTTAITYNWANVIGSTLYHGAQAFTSTEFFISDSDGNLTEVTGTGFTYSGLQQTVTGGTITGLARWTPGIGGGPNGEQITGTSIDAATFLANSSKLASALSGDATYELSQTQLSGSGGTYAINALGAGRKTLSEAGLTSDNLIFEISPITSVGIIPPPSHLLDTTTGISIPFTGLNGFTGGSGQSIFSLDSSPVAGSLVLSAGSGPAVVQMAFGGADSILDLTTQGLFGIGGIQFNSVAYSPGYGAIIELDSGQFGGAGLSANLSVAGDTSLYADELGITMTTTSFNAAGFSFDSAWNNNPNASGPNHVLINGQTSSSNLTIVAPNTNSLIFGGSGNDSLQGGTGNDIFYGSTGNDTINGGAGRNTNGYIFLATSGVTANVQGGAGTVNKGGTNGTDHLTNVQVITGTTSSDVFYLDGNEIVDGYQGFDYLIELTAGVNLAYGTNFFDVSEFVSNTGTNTVDFSADANFVYVYGSTGKDTLTLGSGGGYLFSGGGTLNILNGGFNGTNFLLDSGGTTTMSGGGGTATNYFYVSGATNDTVHGAGAFNVVSQLAATVTVQLGGTNFTSVDEYIANSGTNTVNVSSTDHGFKYLYGGSGNDTLSTGSGGGYLFGEGGTNTLTGGGGTNVFIADGGAGVDTMNGGAGSNLYYIDANSIVHGAGTFNNVIELQQNVVLTLGSAQLGTNVQQVILNGGVNSVDFHTATSAVFLYGGTGNDTLFGGTGSDFLYGGAGTNTFTFASGWGKDTIEDWTAGTTDIIDLMALAASGIHSITDLTQTISGGKDVITSSHTGTNSITLLGVSSALAASSFHFA